MTTPEMQWNAAVLQVLQQNEGQPLHPTEIVDAIEQQGLRSLGASPIPTVRSTLSILRRDNDKVNLSGRGYYVFGQPDEPEPEPLDEEPDDDEEEIKLVTAFGLQWERTNVDWSRSPANGQLLGRQTGGSDDVNFANQRGVYMLHSAQSVVYIGRVTDRGLYQRLREHHRPAGNSTMPLRWQRFSWFGFGDVTDISGAGAPRVSLEEMINVLEAVLIEAVAPPVNGRRGDNLGNLYQQVTPANLSGARARSLLLEALNQPLTR